MIATFERVYQPNPSAGRFDEIAGTAPADWMCGDCGCPVLGHRQAVAGLIGVGRLMVCDSERCAPRDERGWLRRKGDHTCHITLIGETSSIAAHQYEMHAAEELRWLNELKRQREEYL